MSRDAATFACGMANPWTPYRPHPWPDSAVVVQPYRCEHCFCIKDAVHAGTGPHRKCCRCHTVMAEEFVYAWFKILSSGESEQ